MSKVVKNRNIVNPVSITPRQKQVLEWIERHLSIHQTMPSRREIAEGLGLSSPATIQQHIEALEKKGFLKRGETRESRALQWTARSKKLLAARPAIQLLGPSENVNSKTQELNSFQSEEAKSSFIDIPLLGSIAAGYPVEVFSDAKMLSIPLELFISTKQVSSLKGKIFMLSVKGDSMVDEGIFSGDLVILNKTNQVKEGQTVAALLNGESTLKKFHQTKNGVELHPANPRYSIIKVSNEDRFEIQGVMLGLIRKSN